MEELIDIVDINNKVIEKMSKAQAHKKGLLHRTVIAEIIDSKGNWDLVAPAAHKQDAGQFVSPVGGHVAAGETLEQALKREVMEEAGIKDFKYQFVGKGIFNRRVLGHQENHYFFVYQIISDQQPVLCDEHSHHKKFTVKELKKSLKENPNMFGGAFHFVVNNFYQFLLK